LVAMLRVLCAMEVKPNWPPRRQECEEKLNPRQILCYRQPGKDCWTVSRRIVEGGKALKTKKAGQKSHPMPKNSMIFAVSP